jgi:hypothetical protein
MSYLPPIVVRLKADIGDFLAKMELAKAAMDDFGKSGSKSVGAMKKDMDSVFKAIDKDARKSGRNSGKGFWSGWRDAIKEGRKGSDGPSGQVGTWLPWIGAALPMIPELTTAVLGAVGAFSALGIAAGAGLGALAISLKAALKPILAAYSATGKTKAADIKALSPEDLHSYGLLVQFMNRLKAAADNIGSLSLFDKGLSTATGLIKYLAPLARTADHAVTGLLDSFGHSVKSGGFQSFMSELTKMSGPAITIIGQSIEKMAAGIGNMVAAFGRSGDAMAAGRGLLDMMTKFDNWTGGQGFINFLNMAKQDMPLVGHLLASLLRLFVTLFDSLGGGFGRGEIQLITGLSNALAYLLHLGGFGAFLANMLSLALITSKFGSFGLITSSIRYLGASLIKLLVPGAVIASLKDLGTALSMVGQKGGLRLVAGEMGAVAGAAGPLIAGLAGIAAVVTEVVVLNRNYSETAGNQVNALRKQSQAVGWNTQGYKAWGVALHGATARINTIQAATNKNYRTAALYNMQLRQLAAGSNHASQAYASQSRFVRQLGQSLGLTRHQTMLVIAGAKIAASQVDKGGEAYQSAMQKALAYAGSLNHLNDAFANLLQPNLDVIQATVQFKQDQDSLAQAAKAAGDKVGYQTTAQRALASQMATAITDAHGLSDAIRTQTGSNQKALGPLKSLYGELEAMHLKGQAAAQMMRLLKQYIDALQSKTIKINVVYNTIGSPVAQPPTGGGPHINGMQAGLAMQAPGNTEHHTHVYIDGAEVFRGVKSRTYNYNINNGNRSRGGAVAGTMAPR